MPDPASSNPPHRILLIFAAVWILSALAATFLATRFLDGAFPIFTLLLLAVPLLVLLRTRDSGRIGIRPIPLIDFIKYTGLCLAGSLALMAVFEPWSHTYQTLMQAAVSSARPDTTFGWLLHFNDLRGWVGFTLYAGLVTLFAEELFFRGWVLNALIRRMSAWKANLWQASLFTLPQLLAAFLLPPTQGILYAVVYSWLAIGLIGGWAAGRTGSIWPSLASATLYNLVICLVLL
jgi:membrane protease YdiL (CAAX protease family)